MDDRSVSGPEAWQLKWLWQRLASRKGYPGSARMDDMSHLESQRIAAIVGKMLDEAIALEREACARIAEKEEPLGGQGEVADAIRACKGDGPDIVAAIRAEEREACAKLAEKLDMGPMEGCAMAHYIAEAIRVRKDQP